MKKPMFTTAKRIAFALLLAMMITIPTVALRAQSIDEVPTEQRVVAGNGGLLDVLDQIRQAQGQQIEGSWIVTVSPVPPPGVPAPPSFHAYASFGRGGAYNGADRRLPFSKQLGSWVHLGQNEFASTFVADLYDQNGVFTGTIKVRNRYTVNGDQLVAVANAEERDVNGNVTTTRCATVKGERIKVEPLAAQCQSITPPQ